MNLGGLLIRTDASPHIGTGHIMRCIALAQAWRKHGPAVFASVQSTPAIEERVSAEGFVLRKLPVEVGSSRDAIATAELATQVNAAWVIADGYGFDADYQRYLKDAGHRLLFLDDYGQADFYCADLVLNQNIAVAPSTYSRRSPETRVLVGTTYALLRDEFVRWHGWQRDIPAEGKKVLVTLGGADPNNVTAKVVDALELLPNIEAIVVLGGSNRHIRSLRSRCAAGDRSIRLVVNASNMPELMAWADVAVAGAGSTAWELAFFGLPSVVTVLADNQTAIAAALEREGVALVVRDGFVGPEQLAIRLRMLLSDQQKRIQLSQAGRRLVDGLGARRVCEILAGSERLQHMAPAER